MVVWCLPFPPDPPPPLTCPVAHTCHLPHTYLPRAVDTVCLFPTISPPDMPPHCLSCHVVGEVGDNISGYGMVYVTGGRCSTCSAAAEPHTGEHGIGVPYAWRWAWAARGTPRRDRAHRAARQTAMPPTPHATPHLTGVLSYRLHAYHNTGRRRTTTATCYLYETPT